MRRVLLFAALVATTSACTRAFVGRPDPEPVRSDSLYWKAVLHLDASNKNGTTDSALKYLDAYLARDIAEGMLADDPELKRAEHAALRKVLNARYSRALELFRVG